MTKHAQRKRRRRSVVIAALLLGLLAVAVTVTTLWQRSEHQARRVEAQRLYEIGRRTIDQSPSEALAWAIASLELVDDPVVRRLALQTLWRSPVPIIPEEQWEGSSFLIFSDFSPDGSWLMTGTGDGKTILRRSTGGDVHSWKAHWGPTIGWFTPDSKALLTTGLGEPEAFVWTIPDGDRLGAVPGPAELRVTDINPGDGQSLLRVVRIIEDDAAPGGWSMDLEPSMLRRRLQQDQRPRAALGPDGRSLVFARGPEILLADVEAPDGVPRRIGRCGADVRQIAFHPGGDVLASVDTDGVVDMWQLSNQNSTRKRSWLGPASGECDDLRFDPSGRFLAVAYDLGYALVYGLDHPPGAAPLRLLPSGSRMISARFDPSGRWLMTVSMGRVAMWPWDHARSPIILKGHSGPVNRVVLSRSA
jgi:WD40 repeat protein